MIRPFRNPGYDLAGVVAEILESVDGQPPAPGFFLASPTATNPGANTIQVDRRGPAALVVGLRVNGTVGVRMTDRVDLIVGGQSLIEGVLPIEAFMNTTAYPLDFPLALQAPIRLDPSTPMRVEMSALPGETSSGNTTSFRAQVLFASEEAVDAALDELGHARWWSLYGEQGATSLVDTLTVEHGGRPTYAKMTGSIGNMTVDISLDGRSMNPDGPISENNDLLGTSFLPHAVEAGQVYKADFAFAAVTDNAAFWWHGPSEFPR